MSYLGLGVADAKDVCEKVPITFIHDSNLNNLIYT